MTKNLESLSAFENKSINQLELKNVIGGKAMSSGETPTAAGSRQWGATGSGYWSGSYTEDCTGSNGVTSYSYIDSTVHWNECN